MKPATLGQGQQVLQLILQKKTPERRLQKLLEGGFIADLLEATNDVNRKEFRQLLGLGQLTKVPSILKVDRSQSFDPTTFEGLGQGWKIAEQDERSLALTELDLSRVRLETYLREGESRIRGETKLERRKEAGQIGLDAMFFHTLWQNKHLIPEAWKERVNVNIRYIFFDGTVLRSPFGNRCVLCLYWGDGEWYWSYYWLADGFDAVDPSVVLAS